MSRFLLGIWPRFGAGMRRRLITINGSPGIVMFDDTQVHYAFSFEVDGDRVRNIYIICNPDKLRHLAPAMGA